MRGRFTRLAASEFNVPVSRRIPAIACVNELKVFGVAQNDELFAGRRAPCAGKFDRHPPADKNRDGLFRIAHRNQFVGLS